MMTLVTLNVCAETILRTHIISLNPYRKAGNGHHANLMITSEEPRTTAVRSFPHHVTAVQCQHLDVGSLESLFTWWFCLVYLMFESLRKVYCDPDPLSEALVPASMILDLGQAIWA